MSDNKCKVCGCSGDTLGHYYDGWQHITLTDCIGLLKSRITELEADNARLTHVLEVIADSDGHHDHSLTHLQLIEYAKEALDKED